MGIRTLGTRATGGAILCFLLVGLLRAPVADAASFQVTADGWTSLDGGATKDLDSLAYVDNADGSRSVSGSGVSSAGTIGAGAETTHYGAGALLASAGPGVLKVKVDSLAFVNALPFYQPRVFSSASAVMQDAFEVTSATLAPGTMTDYAITMSVDIDHNSPIYYKPEGFPHGTFFLALYYGTNGGYNLNLPVDFGGPSASWPIGTNVSFTQTFTGQALVGSKVPVYLSIGASAQEWVTGGDGFIYQTHIDASKTIKLFVDSSTPGVDLVSDSGHDYSLLAVPEPSTLSLASLALITMVGFRASRRRARNPSDHAGQETAA